MCAYTLSHPHHPSPHTNILASLVKGEVLSPEKIRATTGGIAAPTLPKPHYPLAFCNANICMRRYAFASAPSFALHQHPCLPCQRWQLLETLSAVHNVFHVSQLKKCLRVPDRTIKVTDVALEPDLTYSKHPIQVLDQKNKIT